MRNSQKLHFINRIDKDNAGDWSCCPLLYYYDYFKQFSLIRHDIDFINYNEISKNDIVILGGSGLINVTVSFNKAIIKILNMCSTVILWGGGYNTHDEQWYQGSEFPKIDFHKFSLIGIRDYNHPSGLAYVPCPSVLAFPDPHTDGDRIKGRYGVIEHKDLPIKAFLSKDKLTNNAGMESIYAFIKSHEAVITNSYHCAYWALVLGRKAIVVNKFSTKFDFFKYKPEFVEISENDSAAQIEDKIEKAFYRALVYKNFYDEAVQQNHQFFEKVKKLVEDKKIPKDKDYQNLYQLNIQQLWNLQAEPEKIRRKIHELHEDVKERFQKVDEEIRWFNHQLHDEIYESLDQSHVQLCGQHNSLHDELYEQLDGLHDELYEQLDGLHDEIYERINQLHDEIYAELAQVKEQFKQVQLKSAEQKQKSFFLRLRAGIKNKRCP